MVGFELAGQQLELPDDIAASDELVRKALAPYYPDVVNCQIKRDGGEPFKIIKVGGTKGGTPLSFLVSAPEEINPAVAMCWQLQQQQLNGEASPDQLASRQQEIDKAISQGTTQEQQVKTTLSCLKRLTPVPISRILLGF